LSFESLKLLNAISKVEGELIEGFGIKPKIGYELEFYLTDYSNNQIPHTKAKTFKEFSEDAGFEIEDERGLGQFEVQMSPTTSIANLVEGFYSLKESLSDSALKAGYRVNFLPKPFLDDFGSALHIHLNFLNLNNHNIFAKPSIEENEELLRIIYGILDTLQEGIYYFCKESDFTRFLPKLMAPTHLSWGGNNRTTCIRVPVSSTEDRRLEFRVASAQASIEKVILFLLISALHGLKSNHLFFPRTYGNAFDEQYSLQLLPQSLKESEKIFHERGILKKYLNTFIMGSIS
jgi:glutamine synthetase